MKAPDKITFRYELDPKNELDLYLHMLKTQREDLGKLPEYITVIGSINPFSRVPYREITIEKPMDFINRVISFLEVVPDFAGERLIYLLETLIKIAYYAAQYIDYHYASSPSNSTKNSELATLLSGYSNILMKRAIRLDDQRLPFRLSRMPESILHENSFIIHK